MNGGQLKIVGFFFYMIYSSCVSKNIIYFFKVYHKSNYPKLQTNNIIYIMKYIFRFNIFDD